MNIFDFANAQITDNNPLFIGAKVFDFIQSDKYERIKDLVYSTLNIVGAPKTSPILIWGDFTYINNVFTLTTECAIFYNGEIFRIEAQSISSANPDGLYLNFLNTSDVNSNPQYLKDGSSVNLSRVRKCTITATEVTTGNIYTSVTLINLIFLKNYSSEDSIATLISGTISPNIDRYNSASLLTKNVYASAQLSGSQVTLNITSLPSYVNSYTLTLQGVSTSAISVVFRYFGQAINIDIPIGNGNSAIVEMVKVGQNNYVVKNVFINQQV